MKIEGRQRGVVVIVGVVHPAVQCRPIAHFLLRHQSLEFLGVRVAGVELPEIMGRRIEIKRARAGQGMQQGRIGRRPAVTHAGLVQHFEGRPFAVDQEFARNAGRGEVLVVGHVLPPVAEIFGREGMTVGPFVSGSQMKGENPVVLDLDLFEDVRHQLEIGVIADEAGVAVNGHLSKVPAFGHEQAQLPAVSTDRLPGPVQGVHEGRRRQAFGQRRQAARLDLRRQLRRFLVSRPGRLCSGERRQKECRQHDDGPLHCAASSPPSDGSART